MEMSRPAQELRKHANQILVLLDQGFPFTLGPEERKAILTEAGKVLHKLDTIERDGLSVGLLGGTGVGKSTLMNALAGSRIASASHRRPHTDHVLIYRHKERAVSPFLKESGVPHIEITHGIDSIERTLLCDLPDFDSIAAEHTERVIRFLDHLDLLVWVTSLEKYADARFYEFLKAVPKAKQNFVFVLNKVDLLFQEKNDHNGLDLLDRTVSRFQDHLRQNGLEEPILYALAAEQAMDKDRTERWNQFPLFRKHVLQQREIKEIRTIRSANLDVELKGIFSVLEREAIHLRALERFLDSGLQELGAREAAWIREAGEVLSGWLDKEWRAALLQGRGPSALVGPGQGIDLLLREVRGTGKGEEKSSAPEPAPIVPAEAVVSAFRAQVDEASDRIRRQILIHSLPGLLLDRLESVLNVSARVDSFQSALHQSAAVRVRELSLPSFWWFRVVQHSMYAFLFLLFLMAIGGREAWEGIIADPGLRSALRLAVSWVNTLFSVHGLAALCSYLLLNLYFGYRFYRRYRRVLERAAEKAVEKSREALQEIWANHIRSYAEDLKGFRSDIRTKTSLLDGSK